MTSTLHLSLPDWISQYESNTTLASDEDAMRLVIELSEQNVKEKTGGPFGSLVYDHESGELCSLSVNRVLETNCSAAHAEVLALLLAQQKLGTHDLSLTQYSSLTLVTSSAPCIQCFGALWWSGINRLVYGATTDDVEQITGFQEGPKEHDWLATLPSRSPLPPIEIIPEILRDEATQVLKDYVESGGLIYNPGSSPE